jgi:hypothetical protein
MSWSVAGIGKAPAVAEKIEKDFTNASPCSEPEETARQAARAVIAAALAGQDPSRVVSVNANGSMSNSADWPSTVAKISNSLSITVQPQYGFVE